MKNTLVYIHGAKATENSFNYIRQHIDSNDVMLNYDSENSFAFNLKLMEDQLVNCDKIVFIAHSLGGIYAAYLANKFPEKTVQGITLSTPYGGSEPAIWLKYMMPHKPLFRDVASNSKVIRNLAKMPLTMPWCNIVSHSGQNNLFLMNNDGVVSVGSMKSRSDIDLIDIDVNHYEIVVHPKTVAIIRDRLIKYSYRAVVMPTAGAETANP